MPQGPPHPSPPPSPPPSPATARSAVVLGGRSIVGPFLLRRLAASGLAGEATGRGPAPDSLALPAGFSWRRLDPEAAGGWRAPPGGAVFCLLPLPALPPLLPALGAAAQIVALGTTSIYSKSESDDPAERAYIAAVRDAEQRLSAACADSGATWCLLRPTLVYAPGRDRNVSAIARVVRRFGVFPVAAPGRGLRQPIHADDVARAMLAALDNPRAADRALTIAGGETLSYRDMVARIFQALGRRPLVPALPAGLLGLGLRTAGALGAGRLYSPALFARMNQDLAYDTAEARAALGFAPGPFRPDFENPDADAPTD